MSESNDEEMMPDKAILTEEQIELYRKSMSHLSLPTANALCDLALRGIEDRRDAERYQWLRANHNHEVNQLLCDCDAEPTNIDAAIDRAMAEGRE